MKQQNEKEQRRLQSLAEALTLLPEEDSAIASEEPAFIWGYTLARESMIDVKSPKEVPNKVRYLVISAVAATVAVCGPIDEHGVSVDCDLAAVQTAFNRGWARANPPDTDANGWLAAALTRGLQLRLEEVSSWIKLTRQAVEGILPSSLH